MLWLSLHHLAKEAGTAGTAQTARRVPQRSPPHAWSSHQGCQSPGAGRSPCRPAISAPEAQLFESENRRPWQDTQLGPPKPQSQADRTSASALTKQRHVRERPHTDRPTSACDRPQWKQELRPGASKTQISYCFTAGGQPFARSVLFQTKIDFHTQMTFYRGSKI